VNCGLFCYYQHTVVKITLGEKVITGSTNEENWSMGIKIDETLSITEMLKIMSQSRHLQTLPVVLKSVFFKR
jgi:hypothetical protein